MAHLTKFVSETCLTGFALRDCECLHCCYCKLPIEFLQCNTCARLHDRECVIFQAGFSSHYGGFEGYIKNVKEKNEYNCVVTPFQSTAENGRGVCLIESAH